MRRRLRRRTQSIHLSLLEPLFASVARPTSSADSAKAISQAPAAAVALRKFKSETEIPFCAAHKLSDHNAVKTPVT